MRRASSGCLSPQEWTEWLDGAVSRLTHEVYQKHIDHCRKCRRKYESLSLSMRSLQELARDDAVPAPALHLKVKQRWAWQQGYPVRRRLVLRWMPVAVCVLIVSLGLLTGRPGLSGKAQSYVDLYAEMYLRAEGMATSDFSPFGADRGENP